MLGIRTSWKRSRISKIIAVILPLPLLLLSFLLGGVEVFAAGEYIEHLDHWVSNSDMQITAQNTEREATQGVAEYKIYLRDRINFDGSVGINYRIDGSAWINDRITLDVFAINSGTADPSSKITDIEVISYEFLNNIDAFSFINYSTFSESVSSAGSGYDQNGRTLTYDRKFRIALKDFQSIASSRLTFTTCLTVRAYYENSNPTHYYKNFYYNLNVTNADYSCSFVKNASDFSLLSDIKNGTTSINNSVGSVKSSVDSAASQAHSDAIATQNAINSAASQAHTDAQTAHNDVLKTQDILQNDRTSFSSGMDSLKNDIDTQQGLADTAVDNSVHNYNGALSTIDNVDYDNFFAGQSSPATFWRDVGEYVLDPSNLGQFAGGLVIVTVITLFVFMLRL